MQRAVRMLAALAAACIAHASASAQAQSGDEASQFRRRVEEQTQAHEARIRALEQRQAGESASRPRTNAFNPDLSLILQGRYANLSRDPGDYAIGGILPSGGEVGPGPRGFALAESELVIAANVDPDFAAAFVAALAPEGGAEVENAYLQTLTLPEGFSMRTGRFFSRIGYLNEQHPHAWDFADAPLAYRAFLGGQLADDGVQLRWLAPAELFVEIGAEAGRGASFPASEPNKNGAALGTLFVHLGGDVGASHSWRAGLAQVRTSPRERAYEDTNGAGNPVRNAFTGRSRLWVADFVWKWAPEGNPAATHFKFQAEAFRASENGTLAYDTAGTALEGAYASRRRGGYAQAIYQFTPRWRAGARIDRLDAGTTHLGLVEAGTLSAADFPALAPHRPSARAAMLDWSPSEFSRIRLQLGIDRSRPDAADRQVFVQYILSLGAHGAHLW